MNATAAALEQVRKERERQKFEHWANMDARWSPLDWHEMIADYNAWARRKWALRNLEEARERYAQIAALAVAAIEILDAQLEKSDAVH